tara:strand:+ start:92 stop:598 length:507 start_codon:yes stop_codon:yes gene_type:complete
MEVNMALKKASQPIQVSAQISEAGANTFTQTEVELALNPLDNEVFVVYAIDIGVASPDVSAGNDSFTICSVSTSSRTAIGNISDSNVLAQASKIIVDGVVPFSTISPETPTGDKLDYIGIVATSNLFLQMLGDNNAGAKVAHVRVYGARARADAATYAALVQSEVLSA